MAVPVKHHNGVDLGGWSIRSEVHPCNSSAERDQLEHGLEAPALPEMVFGHSWVRCVHVASNTSISFSCTEALQQWAATCHAPPRLHDGHEITVAASKDWTRERSLVTRNMQIKPFDWTFTTTYKGSATQRGEPAATKDTELAIDYERLKRPDPILYFAEVVLFEDELADNGISSLSVKLRVMPTCFFILQRQWIRVDDVMFRVVDTRFYHQFGTQHVLREYQMREGTFAALADRLPEDRSALSNENLICPILPVLELRTELISLE